MPADAIWKYKQLGDLLLICASEGNLVDADFDPCLELHRTNQVTRAVAWMLGNTAMSAAQRKKAGEAMGNHPSANVTDSAVARGIITAFAWMGKPWRAFSSKEIPDAIKHIGLPPGYDEAQVIASLNELKASVQQALQPHAHAS